MDAEIPTGKVFVVLPAYSYEGYGEPCGVFSTLALADAHAERLKREKWGADYYKVIEFVIDWKVPIPQE